MAGAGESRGAGRGTRDAMPRVLMVDDPSPVVPGAPLPAGHDEESLEYLWLERKEELFSRLRDLGFDAHQLSDEVQKTPRGILGEMEEQVMAADFVILVCSDRLFSELSVSKQDVSMRNFGPLTQLLMHGELLTQFNLEKFICIFLDTPVSKPNAHLLPPVLRGVQNYFLKSPLMGKDEVFAKLAEPNPIKRKLQMRQSPLLRLVYRLHGENPPRPQNDSPERDSSNQPGATPKITVTDSPERDSSNQPGATPKITVTDSPERDSSNQPGPTPKMTMTDSPEGTERDCKQPGPKPVPRESQGNGHHFLDQTPTPGQLLDISQQLCTYESVATQLGISQPDMVAIQRDHAREYKEQKYQALSLWLRQSEHPTLGTLLEAIRQDYPDVARRLQTKFMEGEHY